MVEIPDTLRSVFSGTVRERDGTYVVEVPASEIEHESIGTDETYRVAILDSPQAGANEAQESVEESSAHNDEGRRQPPKPPVEEGEVRDVSIETVGDQGDGIAKVERGYVVIVPGAQPGDEPTVEIDEVRQNVGFASVVEEDFRTPDR